MAGIKDEAVCRKNSLHRQSSNYTYLYL